MKVNISSSYLPQQQQPYIQFPQIYSANIKKNQKKQDKDKQKDNNKHSYSRSKVSNSFTNNQYLYSKSPTRNHLTIVANIADTRYQIIQRVMMEFNWKLQYSQSSKWDIKWIDTSVSVDFLSKMTQNQKINHFPGMYTLTRKNTLAKNLKKLQQLNPQQYNFFPRTFLLPQDHMKLKHYASQTRKRGLLKTFIVKPEANCQGRGIFLTQNINEIQLYEHCVVQKYIPNPLLYKGLKFDLRVYCLLAGCDPLRIYIYNEGLVRLATQKYVFPDEDNMQDLCMHLTNYAINKQSSKYVYNDSIDNLSYGHKKSMAQFFQTLKAHGLKAHNYWSDIKDIIIKSIITGQPHLQHQYRIAQPNNLANNMCFQVLGFDFMIDDSNKSYLLEINHTPSFSTQTPLDQLIKSNLIRDTLILMNITQQQKAFALQQAKLIQQRRVYTGKTIKMTPQERSQKIKQYQDKRQMHQSRNLGSYERIFPSRNKQKQKKYEQLLQTAQIVYKQGNGTVTQQTAASNSNSNSNYQIKALTPNKGSPMKFRVKKLLTNHNQDEINGDQKCEKATFDRQRIQKSISKSKIILQQLNGSQYQQQYYGTKLKDSNQFIKRTIQKQDYNLKQSRQQNKNSLKSPNFQTKNQQMTMFSKNMKNLKERISSKVRVQSGKQ